MVISCSVSTEVMRPDWLSTSSTVLTDEVSAGSDLVTATAAVPDAAPGGSARCRRSESR